MAPSPTVRPQVDALNIGTRGTEALSSTSEEEEEEEEEEDGESSERQRGAERQRDKGRRQPSPDGQREVPMYDARAHTHARA